MKDFFRMMKYAKPYILVLVISILCSVGYVTFNSASIWLSASFMQVVFPEEVHNSTENILSQAGPDMENNINAKIKSATNKLIMRDDPYDSLKILCMMIFLSFVIKNIFFYIKNITLGSVQYHVVTDIRNNLYSRLTVLPLEFYDTRQSGKISSVIINDVKFMQRSFMVGFDQLLVEPLNILVFITGLFIISWQMALAALLILPVTGIVISQIGLSIRRKSKRSARQIAGILSILSETLNGMRIIKAFGMEHFERKKFYKETAKYFSLLYRRKKLDSASTPISELLSVSIGILLLWFGGARVLSGEGLNSEDFLRFVILLFSTIQPIKKLNKANIHIQQGIASATRVFKLMDEEVTIKEKANAINLELFSDKIEYRKVNFKYVTSEQVLNNINFTIKKGESIAFVGRSGAGKSTIIDLLPRFYEVNDGEILFDGKNINDVTISSLRRQIGIVTQETVLFNDTIFNNIAYGKIDATLEEVKAAAIAANAMEFIKLQPEQFNTQIGENGVQFSGGQRQRLAIARALLNNPPILILDEATSSLDTESEEKVQEAVATLMKERTVLVVAHRLSTIKNVDKVIVLEKGRIVESGKHEELLQNPDGIYTKLYKMQFQGKDEIAE